MSVAIVVLFGVYARFPRSSARKRGGGGRSTRQFVQALTGAASAYASAEVANASPLQILE